MKSWLVDLKLERQPDDGVSITVEGFGDEPGAVVSSPCGCPNCVDVAIHVAMRGAYSAPRPKALGKRWRNEPRVNGVPYARCVDDDEGDLIAQSLECFKARRVFSWDRLSVQLVNAGA